jgi:BTB/POZ domain
VSVGPTEVVLKAHQDVLSQSPVFAAFLKYKSLSKQALQIELPDQDPAVFRRVLQHMYGQKLPLAASESNERVEELIEGYILACRLELNVLQDLILKALGKNETGTGCNTVLFAAGKVYKADQARLSFRQFFMTTLKEGIEEEGFEGPDNLGDAVNELVVHGGRIAKDIAEVFQQIHAGGNGDKSGEAKLKVQMRNAQSKIAEPETQINEVRAEKSSTDAQSAELERVLDLTQKETESHSKAAEARTEAAEKDLEALNKTVSNKKIKSKYKKQVKRCARDREQATRTLKLDQKATDQADSANRALDFMNDDEYPTEDWEYHDEHHFES